MNEIYDKNYQVAKINNTIEKLGYGSAASILTLSAGLVFGDVISLPIKDLHDHFAGLLFSIPALFCWIITLISPLYKEDYFPNFKEGDVVNYESRNKNGTPIILGKKPSEFAQLRQKKPCFLIHTVGEFNYLIQNENGNFSEVSFKAQHNLTKTDATFNLKVPTPEAQTINNPVKLTTEMI